jgi:hypothetical protein
MLMPQRSGARSEMVLPRAVDGQVIGAVLKSCLGTRHTQHLNVNPSRCVALAVIPFAIAIPVLAGPYLYSRPIILDMHKVF